ncbi:MAG TPA: uroporphyrinogen-III C-methyltransferase, partial [Gemmatimonadaceae bacterium]|nr:uroporphyrinogen-III C-methyltransferase [Gemmatimonadaceae bacterium]
MEPNEDGARPGMVYLVGAGPGDPGLITVRGRDLLASCDAVVYDALANPTLLAGVEAEKHDVGKRGGTGDSARQDEISTLLVRLAKAGKRVVRLKGGDPFVFGRGSEEAQALAAADIPFEVVPGITAGIAAAAYAGIPVTHRGLSTSVTFVTGHEDPAKGAPTIDWGALARAGGTLVLYMGARSLPRIVAALREGGLANETPAAAVQWGTRAEQRTLVATLATLEARVAEAGLAAPVIFVIGDVVALRKEISWFERRPLFGWRILVTRAQSPKSRLAELLGEAGAEVMEVPATRIEPLDMGPLRATISHLDAYDWIAFTSQNGVELFWSVLRDCGLDTRALAALRVAAVGPATAAALLEHGIAVDVTPERFVAEGVLDALAQRDDIRDARMLYIAAAGARDVLPNGLTALGARVDVVPIYRSVADEAGVEAMRAFAAAGGQGEGEEERSLAAFTSASTVRAYVDAVGVDRARRVGVATIGPTTSAAAREAGLDVRVEAEHLTIPGLVQAIVAHGTSSG